MEQLEEFLVNFDELDELDEVDLPSGGSGFGCSCSDIN